MALGDTPPCNVGFIPPSMIRSPGDETLRDLPPRHVLQSSVQFVLGSARRPQLSVPRISRQACTHCATVPRSARLCANRQHTVARTAGSRSHPYYRPRETYCPTTNSHIYRQGPTVTPGRRSFSCPPAYHLDPDPSRSHRSHYPSRPLLLARSPRRFHIFPPPDHWVPPYGQAPPPAANPPPPPAGDSVNPAPLPAEAPAAAGYRPCRAKRGGDHDLRPAHRKVSIPQRRDRRVFSGI